MLTIINLLIIIFILLITYQIFLAHFSDSIIEGLEDYKEYDTKNQIGLDEILRLKGIYEELDSEGRDGLWDITQALFIIAKEYSELKK
jgi:uncharacterized membrane protein